MAYRDNTRADQIPPYYSQIQDPNGQVRFRNFDDKAIFDEYAAYVESASSRNFVIDFGTEEAWAAFDVGQCEIESLLRSEVRVHPSRSTADKLTARCRGLRRCRRDGCKCMEYTIAWDCQLITFPYKKHLGARAAKRSCEGLLPRAVYNQHADTKPHQSIALHYDFSPRLLGSMCTEPLKPVPIPTNQHKSLLHGMRYLHRDKDNQGDVDEKSIRNSSADLEGHPSSSDQPSIKSTSETLDLNHYRIVDDVWHFSSVDWGRNCKSLGRRLARAYAVVANFVKVSCIGYNSLYQCPGPNSSSGWHSEGEVPVVPAGKRVWTWLVLCGDGKNYAALFCLLHCLTLIS